MDESIFICLLNCFAVYSLDESDLEQGTRRFDIVIAPSLQAGADKG